MSNKLSKKVIFGLFVFFYVPFLYEHGYRYLSATNIDFPTFYWTAKITFEQHGSPYASNAFSEAASLLGQKVYPYLYPPSSLPLLYPLTFLSYGVAKALMLGVNHFCLLLFIYLVIIKIPAIGGRDVFRELATPLSLVYTLVYYPNIANLEHGQINQIVLILLCLTWYVLKKQGRALSIALPLSLAVLMKTYPVLFIPLLITKKRYSAVGWVVGLLLLYSIIAYFVLPGNVWGDWFSKVLPSGGYGQIPFNLFSPAESHNQSINGFTVRIFSPNEFNDTLWSNPVVGRALAYLLSISLMAITIGVSYLASRKSDARELIDLEFSMFLMMMFLVAPLSWESHLVFILPPAIVAIRLLINPTENYVWQLIVALAVCLVAWNLPVANLIWKKGILTLVISAKFYAIVAIWVFFVTRTLPFIRNNSRQEHTPVIALSANLHEMADSNH